MTLVTKLCLFALLTVHCFCDQNIEQNNNKTIQAHKAHRAREREKRKKEIRDFISRSFNWHGNPMPTGDQVRERISELPDYQIPVTTTATPNLRTTHYTERVQSFFPICNYREELLTQLPDIQNIAPQFYKVKFPDKRKDMKIRVNAAKLRLYKLGTESPGQNDRKIRITVSQLKLDVPGRRARPDSNKVVMLDSKMVDAKDPGWLSLDVTGAVSRWHKHTHRPMALMLQVEDDKRKSLKPNSYIQPLNCDADPHTDSLTSHPAPLINGQNLFASLNKNNQPLIDVSTVETPIDEDVPLGSGVWGLPQKTSLNDEDYTGAVQDVEIHHIASPVTEPTPAQDDDLDTQTESDEDTSGTLQTLEEVDYPISPMYGSNVQNRPKNNYGVGWSNPQPIATRIILSREEFEQRKQDKIKQDQRKLDQLNEVESKLDQVEEKEEILEKKVVADQEFMIYLIKTLMTEAEQKKLLPEE